METKALIDLRFPKGVVEVLKAAVEEANKGATGTEFSIEWIEGHNYCDSARKNTHTDEDGYEFEMTNWEYKIKGRFQAWTITKTWGSLPCTSLYFSTSQMRELLKSFEAEND